MAWIARVMVLLMLKYVISANVPYFSDKYVPKENNDTGDVLEQFEDEKLQMLGKVLAHILTQPWPKGVSPILYVENYPSDDTTEPTESEMAIYKDVNNIPYKRSRYYRKYPWKRQNSRYDAENRYLCQPSKEDVFRLLVALHEARQGYKGQSVNFCNRKRPATVIFTNIRFLG